MNEDKFVDLIRPGSGCALAESMEFAVFQYIYKQSSNICDECDYKPCEKMKEDKRREKERRATGFSKPIRGSNAEIAAGLNITKRQVAKMRRRGEL